MHLDSVRTFEKYKSLERNLFNNLINGFDVLPIYFDIRSRSA